MNCCLRLSDYLQVRYRRYVLRHASLFKGENEEKSPGHIKKSFSLLYNESPIVPTPFIELSFQILTTP